MVKKFVYKWQNVELSRTMKRITVIMPDEVYNKVIELAKKEKRKKSPMAAMLIEDGLKLAEKK
jgi:predicted transcriptional regulator